MMCVLIVIGLALVYLNTLFAVLTASGQARRRITIVANPGPFDTVEKAATAEERVNWWDDDLTDDTACTESFAATELRHFLAACTGQNESEIRLAKPKEMPAGGDVFLVGSRDSNALIDSFVQTTDRDFTPNAPESFHIRTFLQGNRTVTVIKGSDRVGTLYGVYAYLEQLGMRFYGLGERDTVFPKGPDELPRELDIIEEPHYLTRGYWVFEDRGERPCFLWMARNRLNLWCALSKDHIHFLKKLGMKLAVGQHNTLSLCIDPKAEYPYNHTKSPGGENKPADPYAVSPDYAGDATGDGKLTYFEAHPQWYALRDGKRSDNFTEYGGNNYCTSNNDATRELAKNVVQMCINGLWKHADFINFWMLDAGKWCECPECEKQGTYTDRLLVVAHAVRTALEEARQQGRLKRNIQIATLAYHETLPPPSKPLPDDFDYDNCFVTFFPIERCFVHALADPTCTEINQALCKNLEGWTVGTARHYKGTILIGEYYNVSSFRSMPLLFTRMMAIDIPWYHRTGSRHFHYMHVPTRQWGTWRLNQYVMGRLLRNINADTDSILAEYFERFYPTTSARMRLFYRELEYASANMKPLKHYVRVENTTYAMRRRLADDQAEIFPYDHLQYEAHHPVLNDGPDVVEIADAMTRARRQIDDALLECQDVTERARLIEDEQRFAYGEAMIRFYYRLVRTALFHRKGDEQQARREFAAGAHQAEILEDVGDLVKVSSSHANDENGLCATQALDAYNFFKGLYGQDKSSPHT